MTQTLMFIVLIALALFSVFAPNLKSGVIAVSVFGLWISFAYLYFHAPDVAIAEAVIASSLGLILLIITLNNYDDITINVAKRIGRRGILEVFVVITLLLVLFLNSQTQSVGDLALLRLVIEDYSQMGRIVGTVPNILMNYRLFDTLFEALMLLISGIGVAHLIKHRRKGKELDQ